MPKKAKSAERLVRTLVGQALIPVGVRKTAKEVRRQAAQMGPVPFVPPPKKSAKGKRG
jgi:hypothetical protein